MISVSVIKQGLSPAALLGAAMVARGEIGLLIVKIGYNETSYVSDAGLNIAIWAILLNTVIEPIVVELLIKFKGEKSGSRPMGYTVTERRGKSTVEFEVILPFKSKIAFGYSRTVLSYSQPRKFSNPLGNQYSYTGSQCHYRS
jgi:hypothetical protein